VATWCKCAGAASAPGGALGLALADRADLLRAHRGTGSQRHLLQTTEPFGEWDLLFHRAELGHRPETVLTWLQPYLNAAVPSSTREGEAPAEPPPSKAREGEAPAEPPSPPHQ
jgi:hypothetical protein